MFHMKQQNKKKVKGSLRMKETIIADAKNAIIEMLDGYVGIIAIYTIMFSIPIII